MPKPSIGIIGAGRLGTVIAKQALKAGYSVTIANSKEPQSLSLILSVLLPGAVAATVSDLLKDNDLILLAIPLHEYTELNPSEFSDKILIDATNYWPSTEGAIKEFSRTDIGSSEVLQGYFNNAVIVKTLNHVAYHEIEEHAQAAGTKNRRAIGLAGDDKNKKSIVSKLVDDIGFDPVDIGSLQQGTVLQPSEPCFNTRFVASEMMNVVKER